jgi:glutamate dehydrogenase/leucine dehydrogenase
MAEPLKMIYEKDAPLDGLKGKTVAVIGFGSQGHAHAQNLRDSGVKVIVANRPDSPNGRLAKEVGFDPMPVDEAVKQGGGEARGPDHRDASGRSAAGGLQEVDRAAPEGGQDVWCDARVQHSL